VGGNLDWWIEAQLRAMLITDLHPLIPDGYFEGEKEKFTIDPSIDKSGHISQEMRWGHLAGTLGKRLFFDNAIAMTARQKSAADVLMNIGMLVAAQAAFQSTANVKRIALEKKVYDGNAGNVAAQLENDQIPVLKENVRGALVQYIRHLSKTEARPLLPLLSREDQIKIGFTISKRKLIFVWFMDHIFAIIFTSVLSTVITAWLLWKLGLN